MQIGSLVTWAYTSDYIGVIVGHWIHDISEEHHWLVHWLTGKYSGDVDAVIECDLEVLCK